MSDYVTDDWPAKPPMNALVNQVHCMDCFELMALLPDNSVDCIATDPPYGFGLDVWDKKIDIEKFIAECDRICKPDSFFAFTIVSPYDLEWRNALEKSSFVFSDHVAWLKRNTGAYSAGLCHAHESIYIYRKGTASYFDVKGKYSDVKVPGLLFDTITAEGLQRYIDALWSYAHTGKQQVANSGRSHIAHKRRSGFNSTRIPYEVNFTTVWSFLPENLTPGNHDLTIAHASVKPVQLIERLIRVLTTETALVLDPFAGSGTTAIAARNTGRQFICGDTDASYVELSRRRLSLPYTVPMFAA